MIDSDKDNVVCILPRAGLGNQLFPLMHAAVFAFVNSLPLTVIGYHHLKLGPYFRCEKTKRSYSGFFTFEKNILSELLDRYKINRWKKSRVFISEPLLEKVYNDSGQKRVYIFEKMPTYHDYFFHLRPHRDLVLYLLHGLLSKKILHELASLKPPDIGVHIRMGDFRKLKSGESFKGGHVRTPESYFMKIISGIRQFSGESNVVHIFSDGRRSEFSELFTLPFIELIEGNSDLVDLLLLSKSKIIVISTGSTFSYWAGFLSDAYMIMHPDHIHARIRPEVTENSPFEGSFLDFLLNKNQTI